MMVMPRIVKKAEEGDSMKKFLLFFIIISIAFLGCSGEKKASNEDIALAQNSIMVVVKKRVKNNKRVSAQTIKKKVVKKTTVSRAKAKKVVVKKNIKIKLKNKVNKPVLDTKKKVAKSNVEVKKKKKKKEVYVYNSHGRQDPFVKPFNEKIAAKKILNKKDSTDSDAYENDFDFSKYFYKGTIKYGHESIGMIENKNGKGIILKVGDVIGGAKVVEITKEKIVLTRIAIRSRGQAKNIILHKVQSEGGK